MTENPFGHGLFADFFNANDPQRASRLVEERVSADFVDHSPAFGAAPTKNGFATTVSLINSALRQNYRVDRTVSEGATHVGIWTAEAEHVGPLMGVPASGARFEVKGITAYELRDGLIVAHWEQFDVPAILRALGLMPQP